MGKAKYDLAQVAGYEVLSKTKVEKNLSTVEEDLIRLMKTLADRKDYAIMKDLERIRKRFNFLNQKMKSFYPGKILRKEEETKFSDPVIFNIMIMLDELLFRDSALFEKIIPKIEEVVVLPNASDPLKVLFNHVSLMLCRMERVIALKNDVKNSTGQNALKIIRTQVPDFFPKHFRSEIKQQLEKNKFENIELNLLKDEEYEKFFFNEIVGTGMEYEQEVIQSALSTVSAQFEGIKVAIDELKEGQTLLRQTQDALGAGLQTLYEGQQDIAASIDDVQLALEKRFDAYTAQLKQKESLEKQEKALENKLDAAKPDEREVTTKALIDLQLNYVELLENLEGNLTGIAQSVSAALDGQGDLDENMKSTLGSAFQTVSHNWQLMREGNITKKAFIGDLLKAVGKTAASKFIGLVIGASGIGLVEQAGSAVGVGGAASFNWLSEGDSEENKDT